MTNPTRNSTIEGVLAFDIMAHKWCMDAVHGTYQYFTKKAQT